MKKYFIALFLMLSLLAIAGRRSGAAVSGTDLEIIELKMTGSESLVLENTSTGVINLKNYLLEYFNNKAPANLNVYTSAQALPDFNLAPGQTILLNGDAAATCGAAVTATLGMALSDTSGYIQLVKVLSQTSVVTYITMDSVSWTNAGSGAIITKVPSATAADGDPNAVWYRQLTDGSWHQYEINTAPCSLLAIVNASAGTTYGQWAAGGAIPTVIKTAATLSVPADDIGLAVPQISEVLPNPGPPQTDANDEFIELYNSNDKPFDLSGFILQAGTTTTHKYTFPKDTTMQPHEFTAFTSGDTGLSLSNTNGQVKLLDPAGNLLGQTDEYTNAKDNYAWVSVDGLWQWTTTPTPNAANKITAPPSSSKNTAASKTAVKGAKTSKTTTATPTADTSSTPDAAKMHPLVLAGIGAAALLYALYEYRHDLENIFYKLRRHRETRRALG